MIEIIKELFNGGEEERCKHELEDIWPSEDNSIWYLTDKRLDGESWSERDACYVKQRGVVKDFICLGCGGERTIETAEVIGGTENIKVKDEMSGEELREFRNNVHGGAFFNGFP